jgi:hypothetical protein
MLIIRLLFYLADGTMDSSFLTGLHLGLSLFSCLLFFKMMIQFGLPNHPIRFVTYMASLCVAAYFIGLALTDLSVISPWAWIRWRSLPLIAGTLCLLLQTIMLVGSFSLIQQKVISRIPVMAALLTFAFFSQHADSLVCGFLLIGGIFLIISVKKARFQKRLYLKMLLMFSLYLIFSYVNNYYAYVVGQIFLFPTVFYIFLFEHSFGVAALIDDLKQAPEGDS